MLPFNECFRVIASEFNNKIFFLGSRTTMTVCAGVPSFSLDAEVLGCQLEDINATREALYRKRQKTKRELKRNLKQSKIVTKHLETFSHYFQNRRIDQ